VGFDLSVASQYRQREVGVGHTSRSSSLLHVEASRTRFFQSGLKTVEARLQVVYVASSWISCGVEAKDGWIDTMGSVGSFYHKIVVFIVLGPRVK
jgi:hypothetical protein